MANILFIHQNYPAQFKHFAPALAARGHSVTATLLRKPHALTPAQQGAARAALLQTTVVQGVTIVPWLLQGKPAQGLYPLLRDFETKVLRGSSLLECLLALRARGYHPDVVVAHPGWGEGLFIKDVWPKTRLVLYGEFFYRQHGGDVGFDPEFARDASVSDALDGARLRLKNVNQWLQILEAEALIAPTRWQASTYPAVVQPRMSVLHEGIDTQLLQAQADTVVRLGAGTGAQRVLRRGSGQVLTFVNRNLEPYRGYHIFMRSLVPLLRREPQLQVLIVGGSGTSYGAPPPAGQTWQQMFAQEVQSQLSIAQWQRVHFLGTLPYAQYCAVLAVSDVHVYLSYPFVLGWSMLEAMSMGCAIVGSNTAPVLEVLEHDRTGVLVDFFDVAALADAAQALLRDAARRARYGLAARRYVQAQFDLHRVTLPAQVQWMERFLAA